MMILDRKKIGVDFADDTSNLGKHLTKTSVLCGMRNILDVL